MRKSLVKNGLTTSIGLNDSTQLQNPEIYKRTLQVLQSLQGQTSHNFNQAVGLIFSNTNMSNNLIMTDILPKNQTNALDKSALEKSVLEKSGI